MRKEYFCNCFDLKNYMDHYTAVDDEENCLYCGHHAVYREVTEKDERMNAKHKEKFEKKKLEILGIKLRELKHGEKIN